MSYNLDRLNSMITSEELYNKSKEIMDEYQTAIDTMMQKSLDDDVTELITTMDINSVGNLEQIAYEETARRMAKYGGIFFNAEIERLMDAYNDDQYDEIEYKIRCELISGLNHSLQNFKIEDML